MKTNDKNNKKSRFITFDTVIITLIAICIIFMINLADYKINEIFESYRYAPISEDILMEEYGSSDEVVDFIPEMCRMVEAYTIHANNEIEQILKIDFITNEDSAIYRTTLFDHPDIIESLETENEGFNLVQIEDEEVAIYFRKVVLTNNNEERIIVLYMSRPDIKYIWMIDLLGYTILVLVLILLVHQMYEKQKVTLKYYNTLANNVRDTITK